MHGLDDEQADYVRCSQIIIDVVTEFLRVSYAQKWDARYFDCVPRLVALRWDEMAPEVRGWLCWEGSGTFTALPGTVDLKGGESKLATSQDKLLRDPAALLAHTLDPPELQTVDEALQCSPRGLR